ncbi:peptidoglycan-binding protein [Streptomyces sp. NPDC052040]|uniref:peptidoglycan-binding domain-containing protein n=1 Tax=unclassified Streptomyces TaxID=2593676 RepID=UPI0037D752E7
MMRMTGRPPQDGARTGHPRHEELSGGETIVFGVGELPCRRRRSRDPRRWAPAGAAGTLMLVGVSLFALASHENGLDATRPGVGAPDAVPSEAAPRAGKAPVADSSSSSVAPSRHDTARAGGETVEASFTDNRNGSATWALPSDSSSRPPSQSTASPSWSSSPARSTTSQPGAPVLRPGDSGAEVMAMQNRLHELGLYAGYRYGDYDADTRDAVRRFQRWAAVADRVQSDALGEYGPATRRELERLEP